METLVISPINMHINHAQGETEYMIDCACTRVYWYSTVANTWVLHYSQMVIAMSGSFTCVAAEISESELSPCMATTMPPRPVSSPHVTIQQTSIAC